MARKPRITLSPEANRALQIWAALEDKTPSDMLSDLVWESIPDDIRRLLDKDRLGEPPEPPITNERPMYEVIKDAPEWQATQIKIEDADGVISRPLTNDLDGRPVDDRCSTIPPSPNMP